MKEPTGTSRLWAVILAGGDGERTRPFIQEWMGRAIPKQYCTFVGTRSMLQHTWDRANRLLVCPRRKVTVLGKNHRLKFPEYFLDRDQGTFLFQPRNCDTGPGVLLPLTYIKAWDPHAVVAIFPADHFIYPEATFTAMVRRAVHAVEVFKDRVILLGVRPTHVDLEYGWIVPGKTLGLISGRGIRGIRGFYEKPDLPRGEHLLAEGALWNTLIMVGTIDTFWELGGACLPYVTKGFDRLRKTIGSAQEGSVLEGIYRDMPSRNFSRDVLERVVSQLGVMELDHMLWSDWGRPERIVESLKALGRKPSFHFSQSISSVSKVSRSEEGVISKVG